MPSKVPSYTMVLWVSICGFRLTQVIRGRRPSSAWSPNDWSLLTLISAHSLSVRLNPTRCSTNRSFSQSRASRKYITSHSELGVKLGGPFDENAFTSCFPSMADSRSPFVQAQVHDVSPLRLRMNFAIFSLMCSGKAGRRHLTPVMRWASFDAMMYSLCRPYIRFSSSGL